MEEMSSGDKVIQAEESLLDAIEVYAALMENKLLVEEYMNFPSSIVVKARRLREIIWAHEGLGTDYLAGLQMAFAKAPKMPEGVQVMTEEDFKASSNGLDEYILAQEDLLAAIEDFGMLLWQGKYSEITTLARELRQAVAEREGLGEGYVDDSAGAMAGVLDG
jgi:hypothetical protein